MPVDLAISSAVLWSIGRFLDCEKPSTVAISLLSCSYTPNGLVLNISLIPGRRCSNCARVSVLRLISCALNCASCRLYRASCRLISLSFFLLAASSVGYRSSNLACTSPNPISPCLAESMMARACSRVPGSSTPVAVTSVSMNFSARAAPSLFCFSWSSRWLRAAIPGNTDNACSRSGNSNRSNVGLGSSLRRYEAYGIDISEIFEDSRVGLLEFTDACELNMLSSPCAGESAHISNRPIPNRINFVLCPISIAAASDHNRSHLRTAGSGNIGDVWILMSREMSPPVMLEREMLN